MSVAGSTLVNMAFATEHPVLAHSEYRPVDEMVRVGGRFEVVSPHEPAGDQPAAIEELERRVDSQIKMPTGYHLQFGGTYEKLQSGRARLMSVPWNTIRPAVGGTATGGAAATSLCNRWPVTSAPSPPGAVVDACCAAGRPTPSCPTSTVSRGPT